MADESFRIHKDYITKLYGKGFPEEEIADLLQQKGVVIDSFDIHEQLKKWRLVPNLSPVPSKDTDDTDDQSQQRNRGLLGLTCHHGGHSHITQTTLSCILVDKHPVLRYKEDIQTHEEFACNFDPIAMIEDIEDTEDGEGEERLFRRRVGMFESIRKVNPTLTIREFFREFDGIMVHPECQEIDKIMIQEYRSSLRLPPRSRTNSSAAKPARVRKRPRK